MSFKKNLSFFFFFFFISLCPHLSSSPNQNIIDEENQTTFILSIDGGGIRGLVPAIILDYIEREINKEGSSVGLAEFFDVIAGTSTGGIIALGLNVPATENKPVYAAYQFRQIYEEEGPTIFASDAKNWFGTGGIIKPKYDNNPLVDVCQKYFLHHRLKESVSHPLIISYAIGDDSENTQTGPLFFTKEDYYLKGAKEVLMTEVARATSAAPSYFSPATIKINGKITRAIDGGVIENNPALVAFNYAKNFNRPNTFLLSIGTGEKEKDLFSAKMLATDQIALGHFGKRLIDVFIEGKSQSVHQQLQKLIDPEKGTYLRLQTKLGANSIELDNIKKINIKNLIRITIEQINTHFKSDLDTIIKSIQASHRSKIDKSKQEEDLRREKAIEALQSFLSASQSTHELLLDDFKLGDKGLEQVFNETRIESMATSPLRKLTLNASNIRHSGVYHLCRFLKKTKTLEFLELRANDLACNDLDFLLEASEHLKNLHIDVRGNYQITKEDFKNYIKMPSSTFESLLKRIKMD